MRRPGVRDSPLRPILNDSQVTSRYTGCSSKVRPQVSKTSYWRLKKSRLCQAPVAQWTRAVGFYPTCREFESLREFQSFICVRSSVDKSIWLRTRGSWVQILPGAPNFQTSVAQRQSRGLLSLCARVRVLPGVPTQLIERPPVKRQSAGSTPVTDSKKGRNQCIQYIQPDNITPPDRSRCSVLQLGGLA